MEVLPIVVSVIGAAIVLSVYYAPPVLGDRWSAVLTDWTGQTREQLSSGLARRMGLWVMGWCWGRFCGQASGRRSRGGRCSSPISPGCSGSSTTLLF